MKLVTFNPFRTIGIPGVHYIKPELMFRESSSIKDAEVILYPEHWQVNSIVYGLKKPVFPSVETIHLGYDKVEMTRAFWTVCPEHVPYTEILGRSESNIRHVLDTFPFPFVAKEPRNSMGRGVFLINSEEDFLKYSEKNETFYVQEYLEMDRDLRVCVIGDEVVAAYWRVSEGFHNNVSKGGLVDVNHIPQEALELTMQVAKQLNVNHAGFDLAYVNGKYYFIEFNTLFGNDALREMKINLQEKIFQYLLKEFKPLQPPNPFGSKQVTPLSS
ncbi:ATP-grasp domain-containing protein [Pseudalkalibacillus sp. Hm43]|uniref:ATP-grasp domain-containing protein n=1 Tax=Pseudalkalibacillus sp. Hm43 TaxID=3450742 RepID=UPI003F429F6C